MAAPDLRRSLNLRIEARRVYVDAAVTVHGARAYIDPRSGSATVVRPARREGNPERAGLTRSPRSLSLSPPLLSLGTERGDAAARGVGARRLWRPGPRGPAGGQAAGPARQPGHGRRARQGLSQLCVCKTHLDHPRSRRPFPAAGAQIYSSVHTPTDAVSYQSRQTTALFLLALCRHHLLSPGHAWPLGDAGDAPVDWPLAVLSAASWIHEHVNEDDLFLVTLDSISASLPAFQVAETRDPRTPFVATVPHLQATTALHCASWMLDDPSLGATSARMLSALQVRRTRDSMAPHAAVGASKLTTLAALRPRRRRPTCGAPPQARSSPAATLPGRGPPS